ncbi:Altered inheritance of mitochondria protein 24, mitochondrial [Pyricularia grisea]|nr:Altered inheritance of mitochondria protein 24, mitochondrial [Pyricularia grisea]
MHGQSAMIRSTPALRPRLRPRFLCRQCRAIQISAAPSTITPKHSGDLLGAPGQAHTRRDTADASFEVLGSPYSLLSVSLSPSQKLYTRRGTLVSVAGKVENAQSTLSLLSPLRRALLGVPFLYQRITSTTPISALIGTASPNTTFSILHLDGTTDWMVTQRNALLAWTGHTLVPSPRVQRGLSLAHWGSTHLTGRGLAALSSPGQVYQVTLAEGEEIVLHPSHVTAYSIDKNPPLPFRLRSASPLRVQIPALPASMTNFMTTLVPTRLSNFMTAMRDTDLYKTIARALFGLRTATRRSIRGDRLFLQFRGPATILMSSRGVRVTEVLTNDDVNEIADSEAGVAARAVELATKPEPNVEAPEVTRGKITGIHVASVGKDGKVKFEDAKGLNDFVG